MKNILSTRDARTVTGHQENNNITVDYYIVGKFGRECLVNLLFSSVWWGKVWQMNRSPKRLLIRITNLDGFSLAIGRFAKFATKLSTHQTFPLYGSLLMIVVIYAYCTQNR